MEIVWTNFNGSITWDQALSVNRMKTAESVTRYLFMILSLNSVFESPYSSPATCWCYACPTMNQVLFRRHRRRLERTGRDTSGSTRLGSSRVATKLPSARIESPGLSLLSRSASPQHRLVLPRSRRYRYCRELPAWRSSRDSEY